MFGAHEPEDEMDRESRLVDVTESLQLRKLLAVGYVQFDRSPGTAIDAFRRVHADSKDGCFDSALLLCTDWAWRRSSAAVLRGILDTEILDDEMLDALAHELLWPPEVVYTHPTGWLGTQFLELSVDPSRPTRTIHLDPPTPMQARRHIRPPLRKWAAQRLLTRGDTEPNAVIEHARQLPTADAAAVVAGAVAAIENLDAGVGDSILETALHWRHKSPRKAALQLLVRRGEVERARSLAAADSDASIRRWGETLSEPPPATLFDQ